MTKMAVIAKELKDALDGLPVHTKQLAEMFRNHGSKNRRNGSELTSLDNRLANRAPQRGSGSGRADELVPRPECLDENGDIDWSQAPGGGFELDGNGEPIMQEHVPAAGDLFDRYGPGNGRYVSPIPESGSYPYNTRSLPYVENPNALHTYRWERDLSDLSSAYESASQEARDKVDALLEKFDLDLNDLTHVSRGTAAPAFGEPGGAVQDLLPLSPDLLIELGMVSEL